MTARPRFRPRPTPPPPTSTPTTRTAPTTGEVVLLHALLAEFDALYAACGEDPTAKQVAELAEIAAAIKAARA